MCYLFAALLFTFNSLSSKSDDIKYRSRSIPLQLHYIYLYIVCLFPFEVILWIWSNLFSGLSLGTKHNYASVTLHLYITYSLFHYFFCVIISYVWPLLFTRLSPNSDTTIQFCPPNFKILKIALPKIKNTCTIITLINTKLQDFPGDSNDHTRTYPDTEKMRLTIDRIHEVQ